MRETEFLKGITPPGAQFGRIIVLLPELRVELGLFSDKAQAEQAEMISKAITLGPFLSKRGIHRNEVVFNKTSENL